jgi:protoheme IX farnesyltransferase
MREKLLAYYQLTKPGIIRGNAVHVLAGGLLASAMGIEWRALLGVLIGTSFVIASACVVNNYIDRDIDAKMKRTKKRPSVTGTVSPRAAGVFASVLALIGIYTLFTFTNPIVVVIGAVAYVMYVVVYGYAKRRTVHSTLIGAIPGALPAMAGYVAIEGALSISSVLVFLLVFLWQMPHFYAISVFRKKDYKAAGVPVLGVVRPTEVVKRYVLGYMIAYLACIGLLIAFDVVGPSAGVLLLAGAAYWLVTHARMRLADDVRWARSVFGVSLILTLLLLCASVLNVFVPPVV